VASGLRGRSIDVQNGEGDGGSSRQLLWAEAEREMGKWGGSDSGVAKWRWSGGGSGRGWHVARSGGDVAVAAAADRCQ
jgi:hypothetical protein